jgi:threonine dehydrogenase-like Zn-dependent dehydrogenase
MGKIQTKLTEGTYLINDSKEPIKYGKVKIYNFPTQATANYPLKKGILCRTVITGFCGSDYNLMRMGQNKELSCKFPKGLNRLINGHEGVVYVPDKKRYAIVLIRGGKAFDPSRFRENEDYFEYGCDRKDGLMAKEGFYNPDMLLYIPEHILPLGKKIPLQLAEKLIFSDPYACILFFYERILDLIPAHNFRLYLEKHTQKQAREKAIKETLSKIVIFGCGGTGLLAAYQFSKNKNSNVVVIARSDKTTSKVKFLDKYTNAKYVRNYGDERKLVKDIISSLKGRANIFFAASGNEIEAKMAFDYKVLNNNGIYASFSVGKEIKIDTIQFGFKNQLIFGAINFRKDHMEEALRILPKLHFDKLVKIYDINELKENPYSFYDKIFNKERDVIKSAVVWDKDLIEI